MSNPIDNRVDSAVYRIAERQGESGARGADRASNAPAATSDTGSADRLDLTGDARVLQALEAELARTPEFDSNRVSALKEAVASGRYEINAERIADKLLSLESQIP